MLDIEATIDLKRMYMMARLNRERSNTLHQVISNPLCKWMKRTKEVMEKYNIYSWELAGTDEDKRFINYTITERVKTQFHARMTNAMEGKSKMTYFMEGKREWEPENPPAYINKLTRKQASVIFKSRTRMIQTKGNYKNGHTDLTCRACKKCPRPISTSYRNAQRYTPMEN